MKTFLLTLCMSIIGQTALGAQSDPRFSFRAAEKSFSIGKTPAKEELIGKWILIGQATGPEQGDSSSDGYWPDGAFHWADYGSGTFRNVAEFRSVQDAFGNTVTETTRKIIGTESGRIYYQDGPSLGVFEDNAFEFSVPSTEEFRGMSFECRTTPSKMLLCAVFLDTSNDRADIWRFLGYKKSQ
jgi:hypothetical protein